MYTANNFIAPFLSTSKTVRLLYPNGKISFTLIVCNYQKSSVSGNFLNIVLEDATKEYKLEFVSNSEAKSAFISLKQAIDTLRPNCEPVSGGVSPVSRFGIEDNFGVQTRSINMQNFLLEVFDASTISFRTKTNNPLINTNFFINSDEVKLENLNLKIGEINNGLLLGKDNGAGKPFIKFSLSTGAITLRPATLNQGAFDIIIPNYGFSSVNLLLSINGLTADAFGNLVLPTGVNSDWNSTSGPSFILNKPILATVATTGSYTSLTNLPIIPTRAVIRTYFAVSNVGIGDATYDNITGVINIPSPVLQINSDWNSTTGVSVILNKPTIPSISGLATNTYVNSQTALKADKATTLTINGVTQDLSQNRIFTITTPTETDPIVRAIVGIVKSNGTIISAAVAGTDYLTPTGSAALLTNFPTFNQNTTGSSGSLTTGRTINITGDITYTSSLFNGLSNVTGIGTLANVNTNIGSFNNVNITVNSKGLVTAVSSGISNDWSLTGNLLAGTEKFGSINNQPIKFYTNNINTMTLEGGGKLLITGNTLINTIIDTGQKLQVVDNTKTQAVFSGWAADGGAFPEQGQIQIGNNVNSCFIIKNDNYRPVLESNSLNASIGISLKVNNVTALTAFSNGVQILTRLNIGGLPVNSNYSFDNFGNGWAYNRNQVSLNENPTSLTSTGGLMTAWNRTGGLGEYSMVFDSRIGANFGSNPSIKIGNYDGTNINYLIDIQKTQLQFGDFTAYESSALLSLNSITKGFLLPRLTTLERNAIVSSSNGLQIYNTTTNKLNYFDSISWKEVSDGSTGWSLTGNTLPIGSNGSNFLGTINNEPLYFKVNNTTAAKLTNSTIMFGDVLNNAVGNKLILFDINSSTIHFTGSGVYDNFIGFEVNGDFTANTTTGIAPMRSSNFKSPVFGPATQYGGVRIEGTKYGVTGKDIVLYSTYAENPEKLIIYGGSQNPHYPVVMMPTGDGNLIVGGDLANDVLSAQLQVRSTTKGFLVPRMTSAQKNAILNPATSLLLYDTTLSSFQYYTGTGWTNLGVTSGIFVDLTTNQTVGGDKTFTGYITASNLSGTNTGDAPLTNGSGTTASGTQVNLGGQVTTDVILECNSINEFTIVGNNAGFKIDPVNGTVSIGDLNNIGKNNIFKIDDINNILYVNNIDSNSKFGINTDDPREALDVNGNARIRTLGSGYVIADSDGILSIGPTPLFSYSLNVGNIGSVPNAQGMTYNSGSNTLNLQPASATFGGVVTTGVQTFGGIKTFSSILNTQGINANANIDVRSGNSILFSNGSNTNYSFMANFDSGGLVTFTGGIGRAYELSNLGVPRYLALATNLTPPPTSGTNRMVIADGSGIFSTLPLPTASIIYTGTLPIVVSSSVISVNDATTTTSGIINITTQSFAGNKTFIGDTIFTKDITVNSLTFGKGGGSVFNNVALGLYVLQNNTTGSNNVGIGSQSLQANTTGTSNLAIGSNSLSANNASNNVAVGANALQSNTSGYQNVGIGSITLNQNTIGNSNVAIGFVSLNANTIGSNNVGIGVSTLQNNTAGNSNTAVGGESLFSNTTGSNNTAIGTTAMRQNTTGNTNIGIGYLSLYSLNGSYDNNVSIGTLALFSMTSGGTNVAIGSQAGQYITGYGANTSANNSIYIGNTSRAFAIAQDNEIVIGYLATGAGSNTVTIGNSNITKTILQSNVYINNSILGNSGGGQNNNNVFGVNALVANTTGQGNIAIGFETLKSNTTGGDVIAIGYQALNKNTTGNDNIAIGIYALLNNLTTNHNTAIGSYSLQNNIGSSNVALGNYSMFSNTTGTNNLAAGYAAMYYNTTGTLNVALGSDALQINTTGTRNMAVGGQSLFSNTLGSYNSGIGFQALYYNTIGNFNTAISSNSMQNNSTGSYNSAIGYQSLLNNTTGLENVATGYNALYTNTTGTANSSLGSSSLFSLSTGDYNTAVGFNTGIGITTGSSNTIIGARVSGLPAALSNNIIIADGAGNQRIRVDATGNVGIGTITPTEKLDVNGKIQANNNLVLRNAAVIEMWNSANTNYGLITLYDDAGFRFMTGGAGQAFTIMSGGNVGIGSINPTEKLHISGNIIASAPTYTTGGYTSLVINSTTGRFESIVSPGGAITYTGTAPIIVSGSVISVNDASATLSGVVNTIAQTFAGNKTFSGSLVASNLSGTNTGDNSTNTQYSSLVSNANHTGDATGSTILTLATVNLNVGTFGSVSTVNTIIVNAKGLITAVTNNAIQITQSQVTNLVADLSAKQSTLISGTNIKTINGNSLLGTGDIVITAGGGGGAVNTIGVTTANGVSGTSSTGGDPRLTITLAAITPTSIVATGSITGSNLSGTNTGDNATNTQYSGFVSNVTHTGDATGSTVLTLATVNSTVGSFGNASSSITITTNAKGLTTAITQQAIQIAESQVTNLITDLAGKQPMLGFTPENISNKDANNGYVGLTLFKINFKNSLNSFTSFLANSNTASRTYTFKDADGTIAFTSDITGINSGTNTGDNATNTQYSGLVSNATHTGDATGSTALTLATVNTNVGTFGSASTINTITVNGKGLITAVTNSSILITESQVTNLISDLAGKQSTLISGTNIKTINGNSLLGFGDIVISAGGGGGGTVITIGVITANGVSATSTMGTDPRLTISLDAITPTSIVASGAISGTNLSGTNTGDNATNTQYSSLISNATHTGDVTGSTILTLATVNANVGSFNNVTVNAKGLVTAASNVAYQASLGFTPYNATNPANYISSYTETDPVVKAIIGIVKSNGTTISAAIAGTDYLSPTGSAAALTSFPIFNQSTTGNAATATNLTGLTTTVATLNNQSGTNTGDNATNSQYSGLVSNATHSGDATGSTILTLATVNANVGSFTNANVTVNAKGLITAISNGAGGGGSGVTTLATIGATPNANGGTISGTTLTLQPASALFGGLVNTTTQTFAGDKKIQGLFTVSTLSTLVSPPLTTGVRKAVVSDEVGLLSFVETEIIINTSTFNTNIVAATIPLGYAISTRIEVQAIAIRTDSPYEGTYNSKKTKVFNSNDSGGITSGTLRDVEPDQYFNSITNTLSFIIKTVTGVNSAEILLVNNGQSMNWTLSIKLIQASVSL